MVEAMNPEIALVSIASDARSAGAQAARHAAAKIRHCLERQDVCRVVFATGSSQLAFYESLCRERDIAWNRVVGFHLDEYLGLEPSHAASFQTYLRRQLTARVPLGAFHFINGQAADLHNECQRLAHCLREASLDLACVGIGENGHLAFNDPPADFESHRPYLVVDLDEACRRQQVGEGWFAELSDVPRRAITMSIRSIMSARSIVCTAPESRKAAAVAAALCGPVTPFVPASILQTHADVAFFLDRESAQMLASRHEC